MPRDSSPETQCFLSGAFVLLVFQNSYLCSLFLVPSHQIVSYCLCLCLIALSGMTITSFFWEFAGQVGHKLSCHLQYYLVIACILVFLLQPLMLPPQIAALQFSITQGTIFYTHLFSCIPTVKCLDICFCRASPSEFVIPLAKYVKAVYHTRISVGMRFRMLFETEESSVRR